MGSIKASTGEADWSGVFQQRGGDLRTDQSVRDMNAVGTEGKMKCITTLHFLKPVIDNKVLQVGLTDMIGIFPNQDQKQILTSIAPLGVKISGLYNVIGENQTLEC